MRIAQVAPLTEAIPPKLYGGTERVVHWLTEELVALGHDVTLFGSGNFAHVGEAGGRMAEGVAPGWISSRRERAALGDAGTRAAKM